MTMVQFNIKIGLLFWRDTMKQQNINNLEINLSRRSLLKGAAVLSGMLATGSFLAALTSSQSWALEAKNLNESQAKTLLNMAKALYPHEGLDDVVYALLVKDIDQACNDPQVFEMVTVGIENLNQPKPFSDLPEQEQYLKLVEIEGSPFFNKVQKQCLTSLYDNAVAYQHFGYQGESYSKGGYLLRGFDDLTWLPNPSADASPAYR